MDAHQILDALSASFFALLGIWAAVVRRHWFLRFSVVSICLLASLLIPAYEVVIEFGLLVSVIVSGIWLARKKRDWRPQFSMETALLMTVVVAVICAVAAKAPELSLHTWSWMTVNGIAPALLALACLWIVFGQPRLRTRLIVAAMGFAPFMAVYHFLRSLQPVVDAYVRGAPWYDEWLKRYEWNNVTRWITWNLPTVGLATAIILSALLTAKASGWFTHENEAKRSTPPRWRLLARVGLVTSLLAVLVPLVYVFYRLLTPPALPTVELPVPNGYDDFAAAGAMIKEHPQILYSNWQSLSDEKRGQLVKEWEPVLAQVRLGLGKECYWPYGDGQNPGEAAFRLSADVYKNFYAILFSLDYEARLGTASQAAAYASLLIEYELNSERGTEILPNWFYPMQGYGLAEVEALTPKMLPQLAVTQCQKFADDLVKLRSDIRSYDQWIVRKWIAEANRDWKSHLYQMSSEWSGRDPFAWDQRRHRYWLARYRALVLRVAVQAYWLQHGVVPAKLVDLEVPKLEWFLDDPFSANQLHYEVDPQGNFSLRSVGDDGMADPPGANPTDDILVTGPAKEEVKAESPER